MRRLKAVFVLIPNSVQTLPIFSIALDHVEPNARPPNVPYSNRRRWISTVIYIPQFGFLLSRVSPHLFTTASFHRFPTNHILTYTPKQTLPGMVIGVELSSCDNHDSHGDQNVLQSPKTLFSVRVDKMDRLA